MKKFLISLFTVITFYCCKTATSYNNIQVETKEALVKAIKSAKPGDVIVMANGEWKNLELKFYGLGTKEAPITLRAETDGEVIITGKSFLKLGGEYLKVEGLYFTDGYTTDKAVIRYKIDNNKIAKHCIVTNCVIKNFTQPNRDKKDHWIEFWGQHNQLDHCYISGKSNQGPTLRVFLKGNENVNTYHKIFANHFGPRPRKGGPRAETMQIGDSYTSMTPAYVKVEKNYFEKCNGEVEIISSKSNFNEFNYNIFDQCEGSLVLRHGNYNKINGNIFIGSDDSNFIGGIRVINTGHWITNNYFYNLRGNEFRAPLAVMNGIPKSPLNRYNQVTDVVVANNTWMNCKSPFHFSVGANLEQKDVLPASEIRSARPERIIIANNIMYSENTSDSLIVAYDDVDGINFYKNISSHPFNTVITKEGVISEKIEMERYSDWLLFPNSQLKEGYTGFDFDKNIRTDLFGRSRENITIGAISQFNNIKGEIDYKIYGTNWFNPNVKRKQPKQTEANNSEEFLKAIENSDIGDTILLTAKNYTITTPVSIKTEIVITSKNKEERAQLHFTGEASGFKLYPNSNLKLTNVELLGDGTQKAFSTLDENMYTTYNLFVDNTQVSNFKTIFEATKGSFADEISITNSELTNCKYGILLNKEIDDKGDYNAEFLTIENSKFSNIAKDVINYYRGGYDESTIGGNLIVKKNTFTNCGKSELNGILIKNRGIVNLEFENNSFINNSPKFTAILWGAKGQKSVNNTIQNSGKIKVEENLSQKLIY
ncbi:chondroitinase-B domain-containing protein [Tenacibaculum agarivorans]|uniref:chondroitinase-B domain-containing protein n=1 Tax=Tenacibaculum agarivorans TaxID=1908389 RepID=UPI00094BB7AE|nr:chondroitinase-B domain-containing protein [Tenacibaculum agarivorans]